MLKGHQFPRTSHQSNRKSNHSSSPTSYYMEVLRLSLGSLPLLFCTEKSRRITPIAYVPVQSLKSHVGNYVVSPLQQVSRMKGSNPWQSKFLHLSLRMTGYSLLVFSDCQEERQPIPIIVLLNILTFAY